MGALLHRLGIVVLALAAILVGGAPSASADPGDGNSGSSDPGGYTATAVTFSGEAAPGGGGVVSVGVPPTCWWEQSRLYREDGSVVDLANADELETWFREDRIAMLTGTFAFARAGYGDWSRWEGPLAKIRAGEKVTPYSPTCRGDAPDCAMVGFSGSALPPSAPLGECGLAFGIGFFPTGAPPAPLVAPADLAQAARDQMVIPDPVVDRNPKVTALGAATLVGLPTWFWVTNPASVGGPAGSRTIRAQVGPAWAQVVARTDGLRLSSPAGGASCGPDVARTRYASGVDEKAACAVSFSRASVGYQDGYPVDASTAWTATWTGSGNTGGTLAPLQRNTTVEVPVAESQSVVIGAR